MIASITTSQASTVHMSSEDQALDRQCRALVECLTGLTVYTTDIQVIVYFLTNIEINIDVENCLVLNSSTKTQNSSNSMPSTCRMLDRIDGVHYRYSSDCLLSY